MIVDAGRSTPYYYHADGVMEAFMRIGNETVVAPDYIVNELILKGTNRSFDALVSAEKKAEYSFTLLAATYRERTGSALEDSDFVSFGLADKSGYLTNAGRLLADQHIVYNSRVFCTRWNELDKGSILWFADGADGPWEWKGPAARSGKCLYGKIFNKKVGFVSREWILDFVNFRRVGYDFDARWDDGLASYKDRELYKTISSEGTILSKRLKKMRNYR